MSADVRLGDRVTVTLSVCSQRFPWPCLRDSAALGFGVGSEASRSASPSGLRISDAQTQERETNETRKRGILISVANEARVLLTSYDSLMRSVMFVCLAAGISASLLLASNAAGGGDGTPAALDDSSLPTWSRKLPNTEQRVTRCQFMCSVCRIRCCMFEGFEQAPLWPEISSTYVSC